VVDIGPEAFRSYNRAAGFTSYVPWVKVGDRISYARYAGKWVEENEKDYLIINDEDVVAILEPKNDVAT
jgi:co-chaperonin GroES (HSP10)